MDANVKLLNRWNAYIYLHRTIKICLDLKHVANEIDQYLPDLLIFVLCNGDNLFHFQLEHFRSAALGCLQTLGRSLFACHPEENRSWSSDLSISYLQTLKIYVRKSQSVQLCGCKPQEHNKILNWLTGKSYKKFLGSELLARMN